MKQMTHKQLATIVLNLGNPDDMRNQARYHALTKKPWARLPDAPKKRREEPAENRHKKATKFSELRKKMPIADQKEARRQ